MSHARISKVTFKSGGATLRVLHTERKEDIDETDWRGVFVDHARTIAESQRKITGFFMVAVYEGGEFNSGSRVDAQTCAIPLSLWPAYVEEIARRKLLTVYEPEGRS